MPSSFWPRFRWLLSWPSGFWRCGRESEREIIGLALWASTTERLLWSVSHDLGKQNFAAPITRFGQSSGDSRSRGRERERGWGSKPGSGGADSTQTEAMDRRERLRRLAMGTIDLARDPYFMRNHLGSYECKLCLTPHNNEGNYLAHTQGKRHHTNLAKRAAREAKEAPAQQQPHKCKVSIRKTD